MLIMGTLKQEAIKVISKLPDTLRSDPPCSAWEDIISLLKLPLTEDWRKITIG